MRWPRSGRHRLCVAGSRRFEMRVWILGQLHDGCWDLGGVFSTKDKAVAQYRGSSDCVWPVEIDEFLGVETYSPPNLEFPLAS